MTYGDSGLHPQDFDLAASNQVRIRPQCQPHIASSPLTPPVRSITGCLWLASLLLASTLVGCGKSSKAVAPAAPGSLIVYAWPEGATISLDGSMPIVSSPMRYQEVAAGSHAVRVVLTGYRDTTLTVAVTAGAETEVNVELGPKPGTPRSAGLWMQTAGYASRIACGQPGRVHVETELPFELLTLDTAGTMIRSKSFPFGYASGVAVTSAGQLYLGRDFVVTHYDPNGAEVDALYYGYFNNGVTPWGSSPHPVIGPGDSVFVLGSFGGNSQQEVSVYVGHDLIVRWPTYWFARELALDPVRKRCYYLSQSDSVLTTTTGGQFTGGWPLGAPVANAIAVGPDGSVFVSLELPPRIRRFSPAGALLAEWGVPVTFYALAVDGAGQVYGGGAYTRRIYRYSP